MNAPLSWPPQGVKGFTNRTRSARRRMQEIERMTPQERVHQQVPKYRELLSITQQVVQNARQALKKKYKKVASLMDGLKMEALRKEIGEYCGLADRVIHQTRRRVIDGEQVPTDDQALGTLGQEDLVPKLHRLARLAP